MDNKPAGITSIKQELRGIRILAAALVVGVFIFVLIAVGFYQFNGPMLDQEADLFGTWLLPGIMLLALLGFFMARFQYQKRIRAIQQSSDDLRGKIAKYREAIVVYMAICEGVAMFSVVLFMLSGNFLLLIITGAMLLLMAVRLYAVKGVAAELNLNWQEQEEINK